MLLTIRVGVMQEKAPRVSIIVLNYNGAPYVERCLRSLFNNAYSNFEVLFVDNKSSDASADMALRLFGTEKRFRLIRNRENFGFSIGNNIGIGHSHAKYVIILNNDTEVAENFVEELMRIAELDSKIASVGCKIIQSDGSILYGPVYMNYGFFVHALDIRTYDMATVCIANCGCAMLLRKSAIEKIGGFDPLLWTDWEDHDLGYRLNLAGYSSVYTPTTKVLHLGGGNYLGMSQKRKERIFRNKLLGYYKNYETINLLLRFPALVLKSLFAATVSSLIKKERSPALRGMFGFLGMIASIRYGRKEIQEMRTVPDGIIFSECRIREDQSFWKAFRTS